MSGGVGDYLHYLVRFSSFLAETGIQPEQLVVFVESTNPAQVETLFARALSNIRVEFTPRRIHWTKTNPLLNVDRALDREQRPAARYVRERGFSEVVDWFLPFCCKELRVDVRALDFLVGSPQPERVCVSSRDKGFLWWPTEAALDRVRAHCSARELMTLGTEDEREPWFPGFRVASSVLEALELASRAGLYIGTDTGTATVRELLSLPNIYCVDQYWIDALMKPYGYWEDTVVGGSRSRFARSIDELDVCLRAELR